MIRTRVRIAAAIQSQRGRLTRSSRCRSVGRRRRGPWSTVSGKRGARGRGHGRGHGCTRRMLVRSVARRRSEAISEESDACPHAQWESRGLPPGGGRVVSKIDGCRPRPGACPYAGREKPEREVRFAVSVASTRLSGRRMSALRQANQVRGLRAKLKQDLRADKVRLGLVLATRAATAVVQSTATAAATRRGSTVG